MQCPNCGNPLKPGARFCARCGQPVYRITEKYEQRRTRNKVIIAVVVTVCILVLAAIGRRMPDDFYQRLVQENVSEQQTAQTTEPPSEKLVFDVFTYYDPYTQIGLTQDEVIALHGEPQAVVQDPEGYTGAVEWQYADRVLRFWEGEVYYLQMRNTAWVYESVDDFREMFGLWEGTTGTPDNAWLYQLLSCGADKVCIGRDYEKKIVTYLSVMFRVPDPWRYVDAYGHAHLLNPPFSFDFSELYHSDTGESASMEIIREQYGEPAVVIDFENGKAVFYYDEMSFVFIDNRLQEVALEQVAWQVEDTEEILPLFGLKKTAQTEAGIFDDYYSASYCGVRYMQGRWDEENKTIYGLRFDFETTFPGL